MKMDKLFFPLRLLESTVLYDADRKRRVYLYINEKYLSTLQKIKRYFRREDKVNEN